MRIQIKDRRIHQKFIPFCAGIACGILISVFLFLIFASQALFGQIWINSNQNTIIKMQIADTITENMEHLEQNGMVGHERKLSQNDGKLEDDDDERKKYIPIEAQLGTLPIEEDSAWERNLSPSRIPAYLSQELKLKKKVFVAIIQPSVHAPSLLDLHQKTWAKDWASSGEGEMTIYAPMGVDVSPSNSINVFHLSEYRIRIHCNLTMLQQKIQQQLNKSPKQTLLLCSLCNDPLQRKPTPVQSSLPQHTTVDRFSSTVCAVRAASSPHTDNPSPAMIYQVLSDICSQHIDTHHNFFIANSNTYVHLPHLLNFTNHVDESMALWIGKKISTNDDERSFLNDPSDYCDLGPGFVMTRHFLQHLCPRIVTCERNYNQNDIPTGLQLARCALRLLNQTCMQHEEGLFHSRGEGELDNPFASEYVYKKSISVHPVSDETSLMKLHYFYLSQQLNDTIRLNQLHHDILENMDNILIQEEGMEDDRLLLGKKGKANVYRHGDVIAWDKIELNGEHKKIFMVDDPQPARDVTDDDEVVLNEVKQFALQQVKREYGWDDDLTIDTMFRRVVPRVGFQYMVDVQHKDLEIATVFLDQPYERLQPISTMVAPTAEINFILPLQDGSPYFKDFMQMFEQACMSGNNQGNISLLLVLYFPKSSSDGFRESGSESLKLLNLYKQKYPHLSLRWINGGFQSFSYSSGISKAIRALPAATLLCSIDLFVQMSPQFLHHARLNTIPGERLYFPAAFQLLENEDLTMHEISRRTGFWRSFDYKLFCGYKQDVVRATAEAPFTSGAELYERAAASGLDVFRAPEYALSVGWPEVNCHSEVLSKNEQQQCDQNLKRTQLSASALR